MMKQFHKLCLIIVLLVSKSFCQECSIEFSGEWLYMLSAIDQPYFAIDTGMDAVIFNGDRIANNQSWHSGYRLEAAYNYRCTNQIKARWTQFHNFCDSRLNNELVNTIYALPAEIVDVTLSAMRDEIGLYYLDLLYTKTFYYQNRLSLAFDMGAQLTKIHLDETITYDTTLIEIQSSFHGFGPELGIEFRYGLCGWLEIKGRANAAVLISKKESKNRNTTGTTLNAYSDNEAYWMGTPSADMRLGLNFDFPFPNSNLRLNCEAGYEIIHFVKSVDRILYFDVFTPGLSFTQQMDLTLHGPYVHLGICF